MIGLGRELREFFGGKAVVDMQISTEFVDGDFACVEVLGVLVFDLWSEVVRGDQAASMLVRKEGILDDKVILLLRGWPHRSDAR